jgi:fumarylacetoacetase
MEKGADFPICAPWRWFDMEVELEAVAGTASGGPVSVAGADAMIFDYALVDDRSAQDILAWEYQPLGPFKSKATATTICPRMAMTAALAPIRMPAPPRSRPFEIWVEAALTPAGGAESVICKTQSRKFYNSPTLQLAHFSIRSCLMSVGDLLGSGYRITFGECSGTILPLIRHPAYNSRRLASPASQYLLVNKPAQLI